MTHDEWAGWWNPYQKEAKLHIGTSREFSERDRLVEMFSWSIPNEAALERLTQLGPIVSVGAGTGWWEFILKERGVDIVATDLHPNRANRFGHHHTWCEVVNQDAQDAVVSHPHRVPFMSWPPHGSSMALEVLRACTAQTLVVVGEPWGCTGCDDFWNELRADWDQEVVTIPRWSIVNDCMLVCTRK